MSAIHRSITIPWKRSTQWKTTLVRLTANAFFSRLAWPVRNAVNKMMKNELAWLWKAQYKNTPLPEEGYPYMVIIEFRSSKKEVSDMDNVGFIWGKFFCDMLKDMDVIKEDNMQYLPTRFYDYVYDEEATKEGELKLHVMPREQGLSYIWSLLSETEDDTN